MKILGIDTSCDDTCISILEIRNWKLEILSNIVSSQVKLHAKYGGVYPSLAKREHIKNLPLVFHKAIKNINLSNIDFIGVTIGPGLEPCLWQGINFAKDLAVKLKKPLIPVNHIEAHIIANFIGENSKFKNRASQERGEVEEEDEVLFARQNSKLLPAVCLVVSGGHTQLILMKGIGKYQLIGETRDDAAGECFDKVARILGLGYPGGPAVAKMAEKFKIKNLKLKISLPRPMIYTKDYDFSFSGLKTAVLYKSQKPSPAKRGEARDEAKPQRPSKVKSQKFIREMCHEVQQAVIDVLIKKTIKAAKDFRVKSIILGGGVAANDELRTQFKLKIEHCKLKIDFLVPPKNLCTDNAAMVAMTAFFNKKKIKKATEIKAEANLKI